MITEKMDMLDIARFWSKVDVGTAFECWPWRDATDNAGYGRFKVIHHATDGAHRVAFELFHKRTAKGKVIRHSCDTPRCCNPLHLTDGSHAANVTDRVIRDRSAKGTRNGRAVLTEAQVVQIRCDRRSLSAIAGEYGVHRDTIRAILEGKTWRHLITSDTDGSAELMGLHTESCARPAPEPANDNDPGPVDRLLISEQSFAM